MATRTGIRRKGNRWEVSVRVTGKLRTQTFPLDTPEAVMIVWREAQRVAKPQAGGLATDATLYLATMRHMPTYAERKFHLEYWVNILGPNRSRHAISTTEINAALSTLRLTKGPTTVRHYRTALLHFYHRLDGKDARNPVRASWRPNDPPLEPRALTPETVLAILHQVKGPKTRARLWVMATTGLPHKALMTLTPERIDWVAQVAHIPQRRKGRGAAGRMLPLSDAAIAALQAFVAADAWGSFSVGGMRSRWQAALVALNLPKTIRPYDLRHSYASLLYRVTGDLATVARLLGHADQKTAQRYSMDAHAAIDAAAVAKVGAQLEYSSEKPSKD